MCFILIKTVMTISSPFVCCCCCCFPQPLTWYGQLKRGASVSAARPPPQHCHLLALTGLSRTRSHVPLCCGADAWPVPNMSGGSDYTPRWPVGPTVRPPLRGLSSGPGRLELWSGASLTFNSQPALCPSVIRTCQWETVLTHQIMAERKLLQGGDILGWQYGDVKCILGGGGGGGGEEERGPGP